MTIEEVITLLRALRMGDLFISVEEADRFALLRAGIFTGTPYSVFDVRVEMGPGEVWWRFFYVGRNTDKSKDVRWWQEFLSMPSIREVHVIRSITVK